MRKYALMVGLLLGLGASAAVAQSTVVTQPQEVTTTNASGTIASGGTYQQIWPRESATRGRVGCTIINQSTHTMFVFAGPIASATHANSVQLAANQAFYCSTGNGGVLRDQISIDGTTADTYYAAIQ